MKKLSDLKLDKLSKSALESKQMDLLRGGDCTCNCDCSCGFTCSCTPYPPGGMANSMTISNNNSNMSTGSNAYMSAGSNVYIPAMAGY